MNKKAQEGLTMTEIVVLVLVALGIAIGLVPIITNYLNPKTKGVDQGTRESISFLREGIEDLIESDKSECFVDFAAQKDLVFVGFSRNIDVIKDTATDRNWLARTWQWLPGTANYNEVEKPATCSDFACIVLCDVGGYFDWGENDVDMSDCISRPRTRPFIFEKVANVKLIKDNKKHDLVLYSNLFQFQRLKLKKTKLTSGLYNFDISVLTEQDVGIIPCRDIKEPQNAQ